MFKTTTIFVLLFTISIAHYASAQRYTHRTKSCFDLMEQVMNAEIKQKHRCVLSERPARIQKDNEAFLQYKYKCSNRSDSFDYVVKVDIGSCAIQTAKSTDEIEPPITSVTLSEAIGIE